MRLDGARGKKQVWRHLFKPDVFREQIHCIEESTSKARNHLGTQDGAKGFLIGAQLF